MSSNPLKAEQAPGLSSVFAWLSSRFSLQTTKFYLFTLASGTIEVYFPEDAFVIVDIIVNQPRVDDSSEGEEDKLLFPLKFDI